MVDQGSAAEIMYPDLYKGLDLRAEDLTPYSSLLMSFERKVIIPKGQIRLPVQIGSVTVEVDFIVVDAFSPYTAIVSKPWLHTLGAVSSTLHQKVKYHPKDKLKRYWVIKPWRGSAWLRPSDISPRLNLRLSVRKN